MSRLLVVGYNPPPCVRGARIEAAHYRTQQFVQPLLDDGHAIRLCGGSHNEPAGVLPTAWQGRLDYHPIAFGQRRWRRALQAAHDAFRPDAVVAVNFSHCLYATALHTERPIWMDIYGDMVTIMQAAAFRAGSDRGLGTTIAFVHEVLRAGDAFSACSAPQQHALVGELAMCGRLNRHTFGYELVHVVLPGAPSPTVPPRVGSRPRRQLAAHGIADDAVVVLWCGGYNTWTDVQTLFRGLEFAMAGAPQLHYVSAGASTYGAPDNAYERLRALIAGSTHRNRFHLLGWRPWSEIAGLYADSDLGISVDARHYETTYGTRTRLVEMLGAGLPVITTLGTDLSRLLLECGAALTFDIGDWRALGEHLRDAAAHPARRHTLADAAQTCASENLSFAATTAPLRAWAAHPAKAPDRLPANRPARGATWQMRTRTAARLMLWHLAGRDR